MARTVICASKRKQNSGIKPEKKWFITESLGIKSFAQAFLKACGFQRRRLWSPTAVGEVLTEKSAGG
ncbi:MAG: hypothetical protein PUB99_00415, partial [Oscillospiraceae bacterium]|nr:hypothetical protein [Oscillospiraceae bacterium]